MHFGVSQVESEGEAKVKRHKVPDAVMPIVDGRGRHCGNHGPDGDSKAEESVICIIHSVC